MTTGKRRIPISNNERAGRTRPEGGAPAPSDPAPSQSGDSGRSTGRAPAPDGVTRGVQTPGTRSDVAETVGANGPQTAQPQTEEPQAAQAEAASANELTRERDTLADSLLRLRAEFENFRKRVARDLVDARDRARGELLGELLPVLDNLERALDAAEHHDEGKVLSGVRMTRDLFVDLLRRSGVEEIETVGAVFDPHVHDAVVEQPSDQDEGVVAAVLERGYRLGDRILRPARVAVSSGRRHSDDPNTAG